MLHQAVCNQLRLESTDSMGSTVDSMLDQNIQPWIIEDDSETCWRTRLSSTGNKSNEIARWAEMLKRMRARAPGIGIPSMKVEGEGNDAVWLTKMSMRYLQRVFLGAKRTLGLREQGKSARQIVVFHWIVAHLYEC